MNTYRVFDVVEFPEFNINEEHEDENQLIFEGTPPLPSTKIKYINENYYGFEYYEIQHTMQFNEDGIAYGYIQEIPMSMQFHLYLKTVDIKCFFKRENNYLFLSAFSPFTKDLYRKLKNENNLGVRVSEYNLNLLQLIDQGNEFLGAWFKKVSTRVSSTGIFGTDLAHDHLFSQLNDDGAELSSVTIPFSTLRISINKVGSISSNQRINQIQDELTIVQSLKDDIIDEIKVN